jgi:5'-nucleotidase
VVKLPTVSSCTLASCALVAATLSACAGASEVPPSPLPRNVDAGTLSDAATQDAASPPVRIQILAINDFHGNLEPPGGSSGFVTVPPDDPWLREHPDAGASLAPDGKNVLVPAGGVAYLAAHIKRLRAQNPNTWVVSAGDLTGASPLVSNLFNDEPAVLAMNLLGLDFEGVGNHDFDRGLHELERLAHGGCSMDDCDAGYVPFVGARYQYLAANVYKSAPPSGGGAYGSGRPETVFPPYAVRDTSGVRLAFIGVTLADTPTVSAPFAVRGLTFKNEAATVNALLPELADQGVDGIVVLIHQGSHQVGGTYDSCEQLTGDLGPFLDALNPEVDIVVSAHTHQAYNCVFETPLGHRLVTSAGSYGRLITRFELTWDPDARKWTDKRAKNVIVTRDIPPDPEVLNLVRRYEDRAAPLTSRVVGHVKGTFLRGNVSDEPTPGEPRVCESLAGELIADAQLMATHAPKDGGAEVAFMNPGGVRTDLFSRGGEGASYALTYAEAFEVQPFGNRLVTMTLSGQQILQLLLAQTVVRRMLQVSKGLSYRWNRTPPQIPNGTWLMTLELGSVRIGDRPLDPKRKYRVTVNSFLAAGGDGFAVLKEGTDRKDGPLDLDALVSYLGKTTSSAKPLEAPAVLPHRISGDACK